jgi:hypothetical protein
MNSQNKSDLLQLAVNIIGLVSAALTLWAALHGG